MFNTITAFFRRFKYLRNNETVVDATEYTQLRLVKAPTLMNEVRLSQAQLGSYVADLKDISLQSDEFKNNIGAICNRLYESEHWKFLITQIKQEQVTKYLFDDPRPSDAWVRGTINGIYIIEDIVKMLGTAYVKPPKGLKEKKDKPES